MTETTLSRPGVMLEVLGQGVLLQGDSRVGKSDLALELVDRGHRLVADDLVELYCQDEALHARCRLGFEGFLEVNGLGIANLTRFYGEQAVVSQTRVSLVLLLSADRVEEYDHLRPSVTEWQALGISVPAWRLPCAGHRNMPLLVETAVRLNHCREQGYDASIDIQSSLTGLLSEGAA